MVDYGDIITDSVESLVTDVVIKAKLEPVSLRVAKTYKIYSIAKTAVKIGGHIWYGNYYSAVDEGVQFIAINKASNVASSWIVRRGGFVTTITVADSGLEISADLIDEVLHPLDSDWLTVLRSRYNSIDNISAHHNSILRRSFRAESQASYVRDQAIRAANIADRQGSPATKRALIAFFPGIENSFIRGDQLRFGQRRYPNATAYRGTLSGMKREGYGVLQSDSSGTYAGMWRDDVPFGYGVRFFPNGIEYRGEYVRPQDQKLSGRNAGVSIHQESGARYVGEHERQLLDGFNMIPDGYGQGQVNNRTLKGIWEAGIFLQHMESKEDMTRMAQESSGRKEVWMRETIQTPFSGVKDYFRKGSSIYLDGSFY